MENLNILEGMSFDSSLSENLDKSVTGEEYKERLITLIKPILQSRFGGHPPKQTIKMAIGRINFACPYCGDSMQNPYKKRANIILRGKHLNFYKCHNCGVFKRVDHFFEDFKVNLELDLVNYMSNNLGNFSSSFEGGIEASLLLDIDNIERYAIDRQELKKRFSLIEISESPVLSWLNNRLQYDHQRFLYNSAKDYILILNLTLSKKIFGAQKRMFKPPRGQNPYMTFRLSKLYEMIEIKKEIPEDIDTLSQFFRIFEINFNLPITLFEGPMDAFLFKNSIANCGANKRFPMDIPLRYWYDDDEVGRKRAIEHIDNGESIFLWTKFKNDYNLPYRKKWDLNDVMIFLKKNGINKPLFDNYFSTSELDIIDV